MTATPKDLTPLVRLPDSGGVAPVDVSGSLPQALRDRCAFVGMRGPVIGASDALLVAKELADQEVS